jgi:PAS domain S-box-containing protein
MKLNLRAKLLMCMALALLWVALVTALNAGMTWTVNRRWHNTAARRTAVADLISSLSREAWGVQQDSSAESIGRISLVLSMTDQLLGMLLTEDESQQLTTFRAGWLDYHAARQDALPSAVITGDTASLGLAALDRLEGLRADNLSALQRDLSAAEAQRGRTQRFLLTIAALGGLTVWLIQVRLVNPSLDSLGWVTDAAQLLAEGDPDWTVTVRSDDEIQVMADALGNVSRKMKQLLAAKQESEEQLQRQVEERSRVSAMLTIEQDRFASLLNLTSDAIVITDAQNTVISINKAAEKLIGWPLGLAAGLPLEQVFRMADQDGDSQLRATIDDTLQGARTLRSITPGRLLTRSGVQRNVVSSSAPVRDASQMIVGAIISFREVQPEEPAT